MAEPQQFQILHISDLHIDEKDNFDRSVVLNSLIDKVKDDLEQGFKPEIVVVTGDIASKGLAAEYDLAKTFFDKLIESLGIDETGIFMVPGNHDVNRKKYRKSDVPVYENMRDLNEELENPEYRADLLKGMDDYFSFVESSYPHLKPVDHRLIPFVNSYQAQCGKKIGLVGMNSAWMCRKSPDEREIAIGEYQVNTAMKKLSRLGKVDLSINLFHHPLQWLWPEDRQRNRHYFNNKIILCGHLHDAGGGYFNDLGGSLYQFQAGGAYLGSESDWPARFHFITFNWQENLIRLDFRKFVRAKRKWSIDGETGDDGKKFFPLIISGKKPTKTTVESTPVRPETYYDWVNENYAHLDAEKLYGKGQAFPLDLPKIFIPLYAYEPGRKTEKDRELDKGQRPANVKALIAQNDYLVIEGHAGSGKTTLLKYLTYCLAQEDKNGFRIKGMDDFLPILILLKDLNDFFHDPAQKITNQLTAQTMLRWYFRCKMGSVLSIETADKFLNAKKAVLLLDGLDELMPQHRDTVVNAFADLRIRNKGNKVVFTGRPHGIQGAVVKRFGEKRINILALNMDQVEEFVRKWFAYLYPGSSGTGSKNAQAMIEETKGHPAIAAMIDNPMMLTAICILYHDGKELPGQRAELYKKFIDNLLYRRFDDSEMVHDYLKTLAYKMHTQDVRSVDRSIAVSVLKDIYKAKPNERKAEYKRRIQETFDYIEPKCGLLKLESGQFNFWHLTFQEFLTARYLVDNSTDFAQAIKGYWKNDWYDEVISLYIGYLSIENKRWANLIVEQVLEAEDSPPFDRWRLAAGTLVDIHQDRREDMVLEQGKNRLLTVMDNSETDPKIRVQAGETLGWLGDPRNLKTFVKIQGGAYDLEDMGKVTIEPFEIGKYPVTNTWFEEFIKAGGYENRELWSPEGQKWLVYTKARQPEFWDDRKWKCPNAPVVGVSWYEAYAFTRWLTLKPDDEYEYSLLSEKQWQAAAAGVAKRAYPWGKKWDKNKCNNDEIKIEKTSPAGIFEKGNTPDGVCDLSGNVWEWTLSDFHSKIELEDFVFDEAMQRLWDENKLEAYFSKRGEKDRQLPVLRGGSWFGGSNDCRCAYRDYGRPSNRNVLIGFRCART
jgi:formylglycine-generating enzyme required for sulfatase activity/predicted MPP superfamily phosphohydrolase/archaellum biogenesis ATPase FlaH